MSETSAEARGCLYDGTAKPATLTKAELKEVTSLLPPETKDPGFSDDDPEGIGKSLHRIARPRPD